MARFARGRSSQVLTHRLSAVSAARLLAVVVVAMASTAVAPATSAQATGCPKPEVGTTGLAPLALLGGRGEHGSQCGCGVRAWAGGGGRPGRV